MHAMQVRDITTVDEWWEAYSLTIPVLTFADADGNNEVSPSSIFRRGDILHST